MPFTPRFLSNLQGDAAPPQSGGCQGLHPLPGLQSAPQNRDTTIVIQLDPYFYLIFSIRYCNHIAFSRICLMLSELPEQHQSPKKPLIESCLWKTMKPCTQKL